MRIGWLMGWAVLEPWFGAMAREALPDAEHAFFPASPEGLERLWDQGPFEWTVGYSLGSLLLLEACARARRTDGLQPAGRFALLAPIFGFPAEEGLGGRASRSQVKHLARWLARDRKAALEDFFRRAGLDVPEEIAAPPSEVLAWGLDKLAGTRTEPVMPDGWLAFCGAEDPFLDAGRIHALEPRVRVVAGAGHHPRALIAAFAREAGRELPQQRR